MLRTLEPPCAYGKYELLERIGSGGMAEVYRASMPGHAGFAKTIVIKRLRPDRARDPAIRSLFIEEAKLAAQVHHENVVQVFELGSLGDDELFMAMEWIDGITLLELQRRVHAKGKAVPPWLAIHVVMEVLEALTYAHDLTDRYGTRRNVVHCDVSPDNIFVARSGDVKLGDFGVACDDTRAEGTRPEITGKIPYAAPEVLNGDRPAHRADVFSCGVVLWEVLTGHRLFWADTDREALSRVCIGDRPAPSNFASGIPPMLDALVIQALEARAERRIPSTRKFLEALAEIYERVRPRTRYVDVAAAVRYLIGDEEEWAAIAPRDVRLPCYRPTIEDDDLDVDPDDIVDIVDSEDLDTFEDPCEASVATPPAEPSESSEAVMPRIDTDDLVYSFIRPRSRAVSNGPAAPVEIPIPGGASSCETSDLSRAPVRAPIPAEPGNRETREMLMPVGNYPPGTLSIVTPTQSIGPADAVVVLSALSEITSAGFGVRAEITGDGRRFMSWHRYLELLGEPIVLPSGKLPRNLFTGALERHSLTSLFGQLARTHATGRLVVVRNATGGVTRFEVHVRDGALTAVRSSFRPFDGFEMLISRPELRPSTLGVELQEVATTAVPLEQIASYDVRHAVERSRGRATQQLLGELFTRSSGQFGFEPNADVAEGTGRPLLRLLVGLVSRTQSPDMLRASVQDLWHVPLVRTAQFHGEARDLGLGSGFASPVGPFGQGRTLVEALTLSAERSDPNVALAIAYLLIELGLLRPAQESEGLTRSPW